MITDEQIAAAARALASAQCVRDKAHTAERNGSPDRDTALRMRDDTAAAESALRHYHGELDKILVQLTYEIDGVRRGSPRKAG